MTILVLCMNIYHSSFYSVIYHWYQSLSGVAPFRLRAAFVLVRKEHGRRARRRFRNEIPHVRG